MGLTLLAVEDNHYSSLTHRLERGGEVFGVEIGEEFTSPSPSQTFLRNVGMAFDPKDTSAKSVPWETLLLDRLEPIGSGGMSHVFRAYQKRLGRYVALKKLKESLQSDPEVSERFRREAKALAKVLHQNVAHIYDFVEEGSETYLVLEYIDGVDLSTIIQKLGALPTDVAMVILLGVGRGLQCIHSHHLIHRDVKPSNIRINTRGEVKLMDFGIALSEEASPLTRPGIMVGSPSYLSPEQVLGDAVTQQSDIFQLGICLYEMLTGTRPFKREGQQTSFQRIREVQYIPVREMNSRVPRPVEKIVNRCLEKNPQERFANVGELLLEIEKVLGLEAVAEKENILLEFLDHEALAKVQVPSQSRVAVSKPSFLKRIPWWFLLGIAVALTRWL